MLETSPELPSYLPLKPSLDVSHCMKRWWPWQRRLSTDEAISDRCTAEGYELAMFLVGTHSFIPLPEGEVPKQPRHTVTQHYAAGIRQKPALCEWESGTWNLIHVHRSEWFNHLPAQVPASKLCLCSLISQWELKLLMQWTGGLIKLIAIYLIHE